MSNEVDSLPLEIYQRPAVEKLLRYVDEHQHLPTPVEFKSSYGVSDTDDGKIKAHRLLIGIHVNELAPLIAELEGKFNEAMDFISQNELVKLLGRSEGGKHHAFIALTAKAREVLRAIKSCESKKVPFNHEKKPQPDLVLFTVNKHETKAVHDAFFKATGTKSEPEPIDGRLYHNLGIVNGTAVYHAISEMGSSGPGGMQQSVDKAIRALEPGAVIAVGIAFGVCEKDQIIGDILLSKQLQLYELQRAGKEIVLRGDRPHATPRLINHFEAFNQISWRGAKLRPGLILSGEKLVDDMNYRDQLITLQPEAVGGEMEGTGLYVASADHKVDWIVIKAICDWADGNKTINKTQRQKKAAKNAAEFLVESLKYATLKRVDPRHSAR